MITTLRSIFVDDQGQGLAEYGLILGLIAVVCVVAVVALQVQITNILTKVSTSL
jgi:pilus assembly protein Flp/PilA